MLKAGRGGLIFSLSEPHLFPTDRVPDPSISVTKFGNVIYEYEDTFSSYSIEGDYMSLSSKGKCF